MALPRHVGPVTRCVFETHNECSILSAQGLPQHCHLSFPTPIQGATHMALVFQGGFAGTAMSVYVAIEGEELKLGGRLFPEDRNRRQVFE